MRGHVGGHSHGDPAGTVDDDVGHRGGQNGRLLAFAVVGGAEVDRVFIELADHVHGCFGEAAFGVARSGWWIVERTEVALRVDEREHPGEVLSHTYQGVVDGRVAVGVVTAHGVADYASRFTERCAWTDPHLQHRPEDPALHRFEAVPHVGDGP